MDLKAIYRKYQRFLRPVLYAKNRVFGLKYSCRGSNNRILGLDRCRMGGCRISISGNDNTVEIGDMSSLYGVSVSIGGSGNHIILGERCYLTGCAFCIEDDGNTITVGEHTYIYGGTELSAIEGTRLEIGKDCLFSADITVRTGDSHAILTREGERINPSADVSIADHVWIGKDAKVLKNARIPADSVVGTGAVVTAGTHGEAGSIFAGNPARPVKTGITWSQQR